LGSATDEKAGVLSMLRQGAGLTTLQVFFDNLDQSQKLMGQIFLEAIQKNFTPGKVRRILGKEPSVQFYSKAFGKYDCTVQLGTMTDSQKQLQFQQLLYLREIGIPVPSNILLDASTLQRKDELIKVLQQQEEQQAQMQQMQSQVQIQLQQAQIQDMHSRAAANEGLGIERASRLQENRELAVERRAKAVADLNSAALDQVRAAKELDDMDIAAVERLLNVVERVKVAQEQGAKDLEANAGAAQTPTPVRSP
jgi:hypothetical protein